MAPSIDNPLTQPITLKLTGKTIPNRLYRSPLSEYVATYDESKIEECGKPLPKYVKMYKTYDIDSIQELAEGGVGLICFGSIPIHRDYMENRANAVLDPTNPWDPVETFTPAIKAAKSKGAICLPQLQFPGRQCPEHINRIPKSSSDVQLEPGLNKTYGKPVPLSIGEIKDLIARYVWASEVLFKAGVDGIIYGGSLENRARFVLEAVDAIKAKLPSDKFIIAAKLNCQDFMEGGTSFQESCTVLKWLEDAGVDFFDISGGTYASPAWRGNAIKGFDPMKSQKEYGSYFLEWAQEMKKILTRAVIGTTGGWRESNRMAEAVGRRKIDMCGLGRPLIMEPDFVRKVLDDEGTKGKL